MRCFQTALLIAKPYKRPEDDVIALHRNQIKALEAREKELIGELNTLKLAEEKRTKQILKEGTEDLAVSAHQRGSETGPPPPTLAYRETPGD